MRFVKHSVAVMISNGNQILATRRAENDDELPGIWGLPAGTCRDTETIEDVIRRIGRDRLGVKLTPIRMLAAGAQDRSAYRLKMELWEVSMDGAPNHAEWKWASMDVFVPGAAVGSLCCELALKSKSRVSS
jgi:ADP-ribose pyrophosphatase YjhB (NUDIX family)